MTDDAQRPVPLTRAIAEFATRRRSATQAPNAAAAATATLDTVGVAVAGRGTDTARLVDEWAAQSRSVGGAVVWGAGRRTSPADAALVNGTAGHALDWDDAAPVLPLHPSTVLVPALLAHPAAAQASGVALTHAFNVGNAVFRAVAEALPVNASLGRGWHTTSTVGRIATVAALGALTGADAGTAAHALGVVASMSGGSVSNFGTMTKPLHAGLAARDGLMAHGLAERGFTANTGQLEHPKGFFALFGDASPEDLAALPDRLDMWETGWPTEWLIKRHPACYGTHHVADAALEARGSFALEDLERIDALIYDHDVQQLIKGRPTTGLEGKFSVEYVIAAALVRGALPLEAFTDEAVKDPRIGALLDRIHYTGDPAEPTRFAKLSIKLKDGRALDVRVDITRGDSRLPLSPEEARAKFVGACASGGWPEEYADAAADALLAFPDATSLGHLDDLLAGPAAAGLNG